MRAPFVYWLFRLSLLFLTVAPAFAADDDKPAPTVHATPAMWTVHGPKGTAYLLGSMHALPKNVEWQTPAITAAMKKSRVFVFEIPMDDDYRRQAGLLMGVNVYLPASTSLVSYFDSQMRADWRAAIEHTGLDPEGLVGVRPWYAARALEDAMSGMVTLDSKEGVDNKVYAFAEAHGARVRGLETAEQSLHGMKRDADTGNELDQLRKAMREAANRPIAPFKKMMLAWEQGDPLALAAAGPDQDKPEARKAILDDRNLAWLPKIEKMLGERQTLFITVGAAHMVGPNGLPNLLRNAGFTVEGPATIPARTASSN